MIPVAKSDLKSCSSSVVWQDLLRRRANGDPVRVEEYLQQVPDSGNESFTIDLIYAEFLARRNAGERPSVQEFINRFPSVADAIKRQFDFHDCMESQIAANLSTSSNASDVILDCEMPAVGGRQTIGQYVVLSELSSGGQAVVYRALHSTLSREVVLKLSRRPLNIDSSSASRLLEEGRILAQLDHPNLARVFDMGIHDGFPYISMEYVRGRTLDNYAREERPSASESAKLVWQVADAVRAAHAMNIVHLDIKPKNVVVDERGRPRLLDFGLSKICDAFNAEGALGAVTGTPQYMAPEQARGDNSLIGRRTDVFALGGLLYSLLCDKGPFAGDSVKETLAAAAKNDWDRKALLTASAPRAVKAICSRAMAGDVNERFQTVHHFANSLKGVARRRVIAIGLIATLAVAISLAGLTWAVSNVRMSKESNSPILTAHARTSEGLYVHLADSLPLRNGDEIKLRASIPGGLYASMFLLTSEGDLEQLNSWEPASAPHDVEYPPAPGATTPLVGPDGTEFVFVCTSRDGPITLDAIQKLWVDSPTLAALPAYTIAFIDNGDVRFEHYGKGLGPAIDHDDPQDSVRRSLAPQINKLHQHYAGVSGIAFSHQQQ